MTTCPFGEPKATHDMKQVPAIIGIRAFNTNGCSKPGTAGHPGIHSNRGYPLACRRWDIWNHRRCEFISQVPVGLPTVGYLEPSSMRIHIAGTRWLADGRA